MAKPMHEFMQDDHALSRSWGDGNEPEILKEMEKAGVVRRKWHEMMAEYQPEALEVYFDRRKRSRVREIEPKVREFVIVAIDAVLAWPNIDSHINAAFEHGATIQELMDVCVTAGNLMGAHSWNFGMSHLDAIIAERKKAGLPVPRDKKGG